MTIPPPVEQPEQARHWFVRLRELRDAETARSGIDLPELSMGMSADFDHGLSGIIQLSLIIIRTVTINKLEAC